MKTLVLSILCVAALKAQSIAITTPAPNATVSGSSGFYFQTSLSSAPSVVKVCYTLDAYPLYNPGIDAPTSMGCSIAAPFSVQYNSFRDGNGPHQVTATAFDSHGNVVATSAAVPFTTANAWPLSYVSGLSVATGTPVTSNWSGMVTVSPTLTGTGASDSKYFSLYVDGFLQSSCGNSSAACTSNPPTLLVDTTPFQNGNHNVCIVAWDNVAGTTYTGPLGGYNGNAGQWCRTISFQNGTLPTGAVFNTSAIYIAPGRTYSLTAKGVLNTDGTITSGISAPVYLSCQTNASLAGGSRYACPQGVATVNSSTGVVTASGNGATQVTGMIPTVTGTDLAISSFFSNQVTSASHPFTQASIGSLLQITAGSCTAGVYQIIAVNITTGSAELNTTAGVGTTGTTGCSYTYGPGHPIWVYVWPTNTLPHFGGAGQILTSYTPGTSMVPHCMFQSAYLLTLEQPYSPGVLKDVSNSGLNCWEVGMVPEPPSSYSTNSSFQSGLNSYISTTEALISGYPNFKFGLIGDSLFGDLYGITSGTPSTWTPSAAQYVFQQWSAQGNVVGTPLIDENAFAFTIQPLAGPITFASSFGQSWLQSIAVSSGTCTATTNGPWSITHGGGTFIIHGSGVANMNSVAPAVYTASAANPNPTYANTSGTFTFTCTGVPNGTYNSTNDPGLTLEPLGAAWTTANPTSTEDYIHYNAIASLYAQAHAVSGVFGLSAPLIGTITVSGSVPLQNWEGNGTQSLPNPVGSGIVTQVGDYNNIYWPHGGSEPYLISRTAAHAINEPGDLGYILKATYGTYNPSIPLVGLTQGTFSAYGLPRYSLPAVTSCAGNTITFSAPHGITNINPGLARVYIAGTTTDTGTNLCANSFYVYGAPTPTTLTVALAATDFTSTGNTANGGTITFQDGSTLAISQINASGTINNCTTELIGTSGLLCGDVMLAATASQNNFRKRGQTFTCSGCSGSGASSWNTRTFLLLPENLNLPAGGTNHGNMHYREIPVLNATGGTATYIPNNNYVLGVSGSIPQQGGSGDMNPAWSMGTCWAAMVDRGAGDRWYQIRPSLSGYSDQWGFTFTGGGSSQNLTEFAATDLAPGQSSMTPHYENGPAVPMFRAASNCDLIWNRWQKYILQPTLPSPDSGQPWVDCTARSGGYGNIVVCWNATDGTQPVTLNLAPYLQSGQQIIEQIVKEHLIGAETILSAGTTSATVSLPPEAAVFFVFPLSVSSELEQPGMAIRLADVAGATDIVVRWAYDPYYLAVAGNISDCGTGSCTPGWDRNIGPIYFQLVYLGSNSAVIATSDVLTM